MGERKGSALSEHERVLAAAGWEKDPRRRKTLRELLAEHRLRIYLYSYADAGQRTAAIDRTRRILLRAARTLNQVPEGCSLSSWIFLALEDDSGRAVDCPDPWRVLATVEKHDAAIPAAAGATPPESEELSRHLDAHPTCRDLRDAYRRFLSLPDQAELIARSGWDRASQDLDHFFHAQFGEDSPAEVSGRHPWRQVLPRLGLSRRVAVAFTLVVLALAALLLRAWQVSQPAARVAKEPTPGAPPAPAERSSRTEAQPMRIHGASMDQEGSDMVFRWNKTAGAQRYRMHILTAKLDTLSVIEDLAQEILRIPPDKVHGLAQGGSYLFQVDALREGRVVASTGPTPFSLP